ncbi:hypothetical protein [Methanoregula sp.]|uniref:hypothetical protein n=1 Tax=Methanoregula sp. TaxID=2052170 RepID=UPI003569EEC4
MTNELINLFEGHDIRVLEKDGEIWFPIYDLSKAWGIDDSTIFKQIERHPDDFSGCVSDVDNLSTGVIKCVNEPGLYAVLSISSVKNVKNPGAKELIKTFRANAPKAIQQLRKKEIAPVGPGSQELDEVVAYDLIEAKQIAELTGTDPKVMQAAALRKLGYSELADVLDPPGPAYVHGETGWYNPSGLVELCDDPDLTAERLNHYLANYREDGQWRPFQVREGKVWRLTPRGTKHGREYPFNLGNGHSEPRISWRESILYASGLKRQAALPERV